VFAAVEFAGELIGLQMGLNFAGFFDPLTGGQTTAVSRFFGVTVSWVFIVTGGHLLVIAGVGTWFGVRAAMDWVAARDQELSEAKLAYQRELVRNQAWQATRAAAERASGYDGRRTQAQHEAALMNQSLQLIAQQKALSEKWQKLDYDDPKSMEILSEDLGKVLEQGLGTIGQVLLRNSDPAHNTVDERRQQEAA